MRQSLRIDATTGNAARGEGLAGAERRMADALTGREMILLFGRCMALRGRRSKNCIFGRFFRLTARTAIEAALATRGGNKPVRPRTALGCLLPSATTRNSPDQAKTGQQHGVSLRLRHCGHAKGHRHAIRFAEVRRRRVELRVVIVAANDE